MISAKINSLVVVEFNAECFILTKYTVWVYFIYMEFEFDPKKSESNKHKHGIDFVEGQALWDDPERLELPAKTVGEQRYMLIGKIEGKYWSAIFMIRDGKTRIISMRHARVKEIEAYED